MSNKKKREALSRISHLISFTIKQGGEESGCDNCGTMLTAGDKVTQTETGDHTFCNQSCANQFFYRNPIDIVDDDDDLIPEGA